MSGMVSKRLEVSAPGAPAACVARAPAGSSLQQLSRDLGNHDFARLVARTRLTRRSRPHELDWLAGAAARSGRDTTALARAVSARTRDEDYFCEGKGRNPNAEPFEEIEGKTRTRLPARRLQRVTITQITPDSELRSGTCGQRNVQWIFSLDKPAPEDGYIVQHIVGKQDIVPCPGKRTGTMRETLNFWEAWPVKKDDLVDWTTTRDGWTDGSTRPPAAGTVGEQTTDGEVKFFGRSKTGDLGDFNVAPADASSAWGPGKVPTSGALPSTPSKPSWWDDASPEKTAVRQALSEWDCCDADPKKHTTRVYAYPVRERCEVKDWF